MSRELPDLRFLSEKTTDYIQGFKDCLKVIAEPAAGVQLINGHKFDDLIEEVDIVTGVKKWIPRISAGGE